MVFYLFIFKSSGMSSSQILRCLLLTFALLTWLQILCPPSSVMDPLYRDAQRSLCQKWCLLPTLWHPAGNLWCPVTRVSSVPMCRRLLTRWPAQRATAYLHLRTCLAVWETFRMSMEAHHSPSLQTWAPCLRMEMPGIITPLNLIMKTSNINSSSSASQGESQTAFLKTIDTTSTMSTTSKDIPDNILPQLQTDPLQVDFTLFCEAPF